MPGRYFSGARVRDPVFLLWIAVVIGAVLRLVWLHVVRPPGERLFSDMELYVEQARRIAEGGDLRPSDVFQAPGTHLLLAGFFVVFGTGGGGIDAATWGWWAMSSATPLLLGLFVGDLVDRSAGALAAAICALWPLYISYAGYFLGEAPGTFFLALTMFLLVRGARSQTGRKYALWAGAGAAAGATIAVRPQLAIVFLAAAAFGLLRLRRNWRAVVAAAAAGAVVVGGVVVHNSIAKDQLTGLSGNSSNVFFHGQCHARDLFVVAPNGAYIHTTSSVELQHDRGRDYVFRTPDADLEGFLWRRGFDCIEDHGFGRAALLGRERPRRALGHDAVPAERRHGLDTQAGALRQRDLLDAAVPARNRRHQRDRAPPQARRAHPDTRVPACCDDAVDPAGDRVLRRAALSPAVRPVRVRALRGAGGAESG